MPGYDLRLWIQRGYPIPFVHSSSDWCTYVYSQSRVMGWKQGGGGGFNFHLKFKPIHATDVTQTAAAALGVNVHS